MKSVTIPLKQTLFIFSSIPTSLTHTYKNAIWVSWNLNGLISSFQSTALQQDHGNHGRINPSKQTNICLIQRAKILLLSPCLQHIAEAILTKDICQETIEYEIRGGVQISHNIPSQTMQRGDFNDYPKYIVMKRKCKIFVNYHFNSASFRRHIFSMGFTLNILA